MKKVSEVMRLLVWGFCFFSIVMLCACGNSTGGGSTGTATVGGSAPGQTASEISGRITLAGEGLADVDVVLSGSATAVVLTDAQGNYRFVGVPDGSYTVTPLGTDLFFDPAQKALTISGSNVQDQAFRGVQRFCRAYYGGFGAPWRTSDGGHIVGGSISDSHGRGAWAVKFDRRANIAWQKTYTQSALYEPTPAFKEIVQTRDGGYIAVGYLLVTLYPMSLGRSYEYALAVRMDAGGRTLWSRAYGPDNVSNPWSFSSVSQTSDGCFLAVLSGSQPLKLVKLTPDGDVQFLKGKNSTSSEHWSLVRATPDGGGIIGGYAGTLGANKDAWLIKTDSIGDIVWQKVYQGTELSAIQAMPDGGCIAAGSITTLQPANYELTLGWAVRIDPLGNIIWQKTYSPNSGAFRDIRPTSDGGYAGMGCDGNGNSWILKLDADGFPQWRKVYTAYTARQCLSGVQETADGGYLLTGGGVLLKVGIDGAFPSLDVTLPTRADETSVSVLTPPMDGGMVLGPLVPKYTNAVSDSDTDTSITNLVVTSGSPNLPPSTLPPSAASFLSISGRIARGGHPVSGIKVTVSGAASSSAVTDNDGNYRFTGLQKGLYQVTPSREGFIFSPPGIAATVNDASVTGQDFAAATYSLERFQAANGMDYFFSVEPVSDGGYIAVGQVLGNTRDGWVVKFDFDGYVQWQKSYAVTGLHNAQGLFTSVRPLSDGTYLLSGTVDSTVVDSGGSYVPTSQALAVKINGDGTVQWAKLYGPNQTYGYYFSFDTMAETSDGGYFVGAQTRFGLEGRRYPRLVKLAPMGNVQWVRVYSGGVFTSFLPTPEGSFLVTQDQGYVSRMDVSGTFQWRRAYENTGLNTVVRTNDGYYAVAGSYITGTWPDGSHETLPWAAKIDPSGNIQWEKRYATGSSLDEMGYFAGFRVTSDAGFIGTGLSSTREILKIDSRGERQWWKTLNVDGYLTPIFQVDDEGYLAAGNIQQQGYSAPFEAWIVKLSPDGTLPPVTADVAGGALATSVNVIVNVDSSSFVDTVSLPAVDATMSVTDTNVFVTERLF